MTFASLVPGGAFASTDLQSSNEEFQKKSEEIVIGEEFTVEYEGIEFVTNFEMDAEHLDWLYRQVNTTTAPSMIGPLWVDPGVTTGINVTKPAYKTFTNFWARALITAVGTWVAIVNPLSEAKAIALAGSVFIATEYATPTYVGAWTYKVYDNTYKAYKRYTTIVHYYHSNYSSPIRVQVMDLGFE